MFKVINKNSRTTSFSNTKINVTKVGTEKEDEKIESGPHTSLQMVFKMPKIVFLSNFVLDPA